MNLQNSGPLSGVTNVDKTSCGLKGEKGARMGEAFSSRELVSGALRGRITSSHHASAIEAPLGSGVASSRPQGV